METKEVIAKIDKRRDQILQGKLWQDGETLSRMIVELTALNTYLGEHIADVENRANEAEREYKLYKNSYISSSDGAVGRAEAEANSSSEYQEILQEYNKLTYAYRLMSIKRQDTNNLVDAMRSRLSFMKSDKDKYEKAS